MKVSREAFKFFHEHAGYSVPPGKAVCAIEYARAEQVLERSGAVVEWEHDDFPWDGDMDWQDHWEGPFCAYVQHEGETIAALGGIVLDGYDANYRRVVEAELALEAMDALMPYVDAAPVGESIATR